MTETCNDARPPLVTHVTMTSAPDVDRAVLRPLHAALVTKDLLPARHFINAACNDADGLVAAARDRGVTLIGLVPKDDRWYAPREGVFIIEAFHID